MLDLHTLNYLSEPIFAIYDGDDEEDIKYELKTFFDKLITRKRSDTIDTGLQAGGVVLPDKAGFKISERDGKASHAQAQENVSQYLNGESAFTSEEGVGILTSRKDDPNCWANITKHGFTVRIVATKYTLVFIFHTHNYNANKFQLNIITELFSYLKKAYEKGVIKNAYVNYVTGKDKFVFREFLDVEEQLEQLEKLLSDRLEAENKKTRTI